MTQKKLAQAGKISNEMKIIVKKEGIVLKDLIKKVAQGRIVIPANKNHLKLHFSPIGIGENLKTKINANIGTSKVSCSLKHELEKVAICKKYQADTLMDLSTAGDLDQIRTEIIKQAKMPVGTVPLYQIVEEYGVSDFSPQDCLKVIEKQAQQGVDYITIHAGFKQKFLPLLKSRTIATVSRGGGILKKWMEVNKQENPLLQVFDQITAICKKYDVTYSLGDTLRPGCLADANDKAQIAELKFLGELTKRAWEQDVQVMIEGPGHVPIHMIEEQVKLEKKYCYKAPFYVLGPLTIDSGVGYDHITGAIGGAVAAAAGADMLCYVTPSEHLALPSIDDVKEGIIAFKIAARSGDVAKNVPGSWELEKNMSLYRHQLDWKNQCKLSLDSEKFIKYRKSLNKGKACGMCDEKFCPMKF